VRIDAASDPFKRLIALAVSVVSWDAGIAAAESGEVEGAEEDGIEERGTDILLIMESDECTS
jgi:hypothetical protein